MPSSISFEAGSGGVRPKVIVFDVQATTVRHRATAAHNDARILRRLSDCRRDLAIRGPGELLGTRQTGLAAFRIALLPEHEDLLIEAQAVAARLYEHDLPRAQALMQRWAGARLTSPESE